VEVDVAIIGAGPAGSALAALLASRGVGVALVDRDTFPRDKLCGEFLSYDALPVIDLLGLDLEAHGTPTIRTCRVVGETRTYQFDFPAAARGVSRMLLDDLLIQRAASLGARRLDGHLVVGLEKRAIAFEGREPLSANLIVGAWGRWGRFDRQLGRAFVRDRTHRHFGFKRHYRSHAPRDETIDLYSYDRGYLGVNSVEGETTNICGLVHADRIAKMKGGWNGFIHSLRGESPALERLFGANDPVQDEFLSCEPVIFRPRNPVEGGVIMIGDASGLIDPLTGNGMAMALQSALLAAPFVLGALRGAPPDGYAAAHRDFFGARIGWSRRIAFLLSRPRLLENAMRLSSWDGPGRFLLERTRARQAKLDPAVRAWKQA
jgi:flavin-dependent dehydrogenase